MTECEYLSKKNGNRMCTAFADNSEAHLWCEKENEYKKCYKRYRRIKQQLGVYQRALRIGM